MTRNEKAMLLRMLGRSDPRPWWQRPEITRAERKRALARLMARGYVENHRWGYPGRNRSYNNYVLTAAGMAQATRIALATETPPYDPHGFGHRRGGISARYDAYGYRVYG